MLLLYCSFTTAWLIASKKMYLCRVHCPISSSFARLLFNICLLFRYTYANIVDMDTFQNEKERKRKETEGRKRRKNFFILRLSFSLFPLSPFSLSFSSFTTHTSPPHHRAFSNGNPTKQTEQDKKNYERNRKNDK